MTADTPRGGHEFAKFLLDRIAEDEAAARETAPGTYFADGRGDYYRASQDNGIGYVWTTRARILAECAAKRAIVTRYVDNLDLALSYRKLLPPTPWPVGWTEHRLQEARLATSLEACVALVAVYADHPDYDDTWIPR
jgi:hypothetical protein